MQSKEGAWKKFVTVENILLFITVAVGLISIPYRLLPGVTPATAETILAVLILLTTAQLAAKFSEIKQGEKWDEHERTQQEIAQAIKDFPSGRLKRRRDIMPLDKFTENAEGILVIARTASKVSGLTNFFQKKLERGCRLRFVVTNPEAYDHNDIEAVTPIPLTGKEALDVFKADLTSTLANIRYLHELAEKTSGKVEVRLVNYISNLSFVVLDNGDGRGSIIVELMPYKCQILDRPYIELSSHDPDTHWYDLFRDTCEDIWEHSTKMKIRE
ncbi:MAG: hypothetical protein FJ009_16945 [Chloroflexi bacterium]|nr:hypothetical protein [Chloroflexota bacterium]